MGSLGPSQLLGWASCASYLAETWIVPTSSFHQVLSFFHCLPFKRSWVTRQKKRSEGGWLGRGWVLGYPSSHSVSPRSGQLLGLAVHSTIVCYTWYHSLKSSRPISFRTAPSRKKSTSKYRFSSPNINGWLPPPPILYWGLFERAIAELQHKDQILFLVWY